MNRTGYVAAFVLVLSAAGRGDRCAGQPGPGGWPAATGGNHLYQRGEKLRVGWFDPDGNFVPDPAYPPYALPPKNIPFGSFVLAGSSVEAYEHRSGRLIRGAMAPSGGFVPETGSAVEALRDARARAGFPDRLVWNLPESYAAFWTPDRKKRFPDGLPAAPAPPPAGAPAGYEFVPYTKAFPPEKQPWRGRVIGDLIELGHLTPAGEFAPAYDLPLMSRRHALSPVKFSPDDPLRYYTLPNLLNRATTEEVYEFRSGRLIKGTLHDTGNFVPELGGKVLDFKDYVNAPGSPRIYNLPGVLRKAAK